MTIPASSFAFFRGHGLGPAEALSLARAELQFEAVPPAKRRLSWYEDRPQHDKQEIQDQMLRILRSIGMPLVCCVEFQAPSGVWLYGDHGAHAPNADRRLAAARHKRAGLAMVKRHL